MNNKRCPKCGFYNSADSNFCEKCGESLANAVNEKTPVIQKPNRFKNVDIKKVIIASVAGVIAAAAIIFGIKYFTTMEVDLIEYAEKAGDGIVYAVGYDGNGLLQWNTEPYREQLTSSEIENKIYNASKNYYDDEEENTPEEDYYEFLSNVELKANKETDLSNGDEIKICVTADKGEEEYVEDILKIRIKGNGKEFTAKIKDLPERLDTEAFLNDAELMKAIENKAIGVIRTDNEYLTEKGATAATESIYYLKKTLKKESQYTDEDDESVKLWHDGLIYILKTKEKEYSSDKKFKTYYRAVKVESKDGTFNKDNVNNLECVYYGDGYLDDSRYESLEDLQAEISSENDYYNTNYGIETEAIKVK